MGCRPAGQKFALEGQAQTTIKLPEGRIGTSRARAGPARPGAAGAAQGRRSAGAQTVYRRQKIPCATIITTSATIQYPASTLRA